MVRKPFVILALATSLIVAVAAFNASARANSETSFSVRGYFFSADQTYQNPNHSWVLKCG